MRNIKKILTLIIIASIFSFTILFDSGQIFVNAGVSCRGTCHSCGPRATGDTRSCSRGDDGAEQKCCYDEECNGHCSNDRNAPCGNCDYFCTPPSCTCTPVSCPPTNPPTKYRQKSVATGTGRTCSGPNDCNPSTFTCDPTYKNSVPTCSITPSSISMNRSDAPKSFNLRVRDADWGDTVKVTGVKVVDGSGNLKSCVDVRTSGGNTLTNLVVRPGGNDPAVLAKNTTLIADARSAYGIYDTNGLCSGNIEIELTDISPEANSLDTPAHVTCSVAVSVTNDLPVISNIKIEDRDSDPTLRRSGNLATQYRVNDGRGALPVGSMWEELRVRRCTSPVYLQSNYGACPTNSWEPKATRTNPYALSFTVSDAQGMKDIKDLSFWIQRRSIGDTPSSPVTSGEVRQSIQATIGDVGNYNISGTSYFTAAPCLGSICSDDILDQDMLAYTLIRNKPTAAQGGVSTSNKRRSSYKQWLTDNFPNCLYRAGSCNLSNVPDTSESTATFDTGNWRNFDWTTAAKTGEMLCLSTKDNTARSVPESTDGLCPTSCAACVALEKFESNPTNPSTAIDVSFLVWMNDKYMNSGSGDSGMEAGLYEVYVGASDKVAGNAYRANYYGAVVGTWASPTNTNRFRMLFDYEPPVIADFDIELSGTDAMNGFGSIEDSASGIAGWANRFMIKEDYPVDPVEPKEYLIDSSGNDWNGTDFPANTDLSGTLKNKTFSYTGYGITGSSGVLGGFCTYDRAGNMCCATSYAVSGGTTESINSCDNYGTIGVVNVMTPWIQTTLGSVYSNSSSVGTAIDISVSNAGKSLTDPANLDRIPNGIDQSNGVAFGGLLVSGSSSASITGANKPLGYNSDKRNTDASVRNIYNLTDVDDRSWYGVISSLARKNCDISGDCYEISNNLSQVTNQGTGIIEINSDINNYSSTLLCKGRHVIFINDGVTVRLAEVRKNSPDDGCLFVIGNNAKLYILDVDSKPITSFDRFDAGVVVSEGGEFITSGPISLAGRSDRLQVYGFLFNDSTNLPPTLLRDLADDQKNTDYPSEWFLYDANLLTVFRDILGNNRSVDVICGTSEHVLCQGR